MLILCGLLWRCCGRNWFPDLDDFDIPLLKQHGIDRKMSEIVISGRLITLIVFFAKNLVVKCRNPHEFSLLRSPMIETAYENSAAFLLQRHEKAAAEGEAMRKHSGLMKMRKPRRRVSSVGKSRAMLLTDLTAAFTERLHAMDDDALVAEHEERFAEAVLARLRDEQAGDGADAAGKDTLDGQADA